VTVPFRQEGLGLDVKVVVVAVCALSEIALKANPASRKINTRKALRKAIPMCLFLKGGGYVFRSEHM
jgi:hypothetical protein